MTRLVEIQASLHSEMTRLNDLIASTLHSESELMNSIVGRYLQVKGKQLRPLLALLSARLFGGVNDAALHAAAAVEMLHNASLIHDDVLDLASERRGAPTINSMWDNHVAVLVGDYFVTGALRCAVHTRNSDILNELAKMGSDLSLGEIDQVWHAKSRDIDEAGYLRIVEQKTASLFECCVAVGGYASHAPALQLDALRRYARLLGVAFQIKDDTFDYFDDPVVGKPTGNDLREGKITLPLIYALRQSHHPERADMCAIIGHMPLTSDEIDRLVEFAKQAGGIEYAQTTMERLYLEADEQLAVFEPCDTIESLRAIFRFIIDRNK
ncbi:MAG: polyprenyl synthetase family protein [Muribaculaceae bacterium]|nr:polyprenyl synthetase family protein [Muribaculaceae bacterium]